MKQNTYNKSYVLYFALLFIFSILLVSCGGGISDDEIIDVIYQPTFVFNETRNWEVTSKGECDEISTSGEAKGIEEAWIIGYSFEFYDNSSSEWVMYSDDNVIVKQNGRWEDYGDWARCP